MHYIQFAANISKLYSNMLRHKRIVHLSLYNFKNYLNSYDCRNFHTTDCFFLRRIASSRKVYHEIRSSPEENIVAGNFEPQPVTKTFNNFYGIESDEGVVHIRTQPNPIKCSEDSLIDKFTSKQMSEKFKNKCFGKMRLDSENKVIIHGQFEENTTTPEINEIGKATRSRKLAIENLDTNTNLSDEQALLPGVESLNYKKSKFDASIQLERVKSTTGSQFKVSESDIIKEHNHQLSNDISLIDESYFPEKLLKGNQTIVTNSSTSKESVYIHEFESKNDKDATFSIVNANLDVGNVRVGVSSLRDSHELSEENNSFIELLSTSKLKSKSNKSHQNSISETTAEPTVKNNNLSQPTVFSNNEETEFIDEYYFQDKVIEKYSKGETSSVDNIAEKARSHDNEKEAIIYQSNSHLKAKNAEYNMDKFSGYGLDTSFLKKMSNEPETPFFNSHRLNQTSNNNSPILKHSDKNQINKFSNHEAVKEQLNARSTSSSTHISSFSEGSLSNKNITALDKSRTNRTKVLEKDEALSGKEANDQDQQPETAFDFVKKLRRNQVLTYHEKISGFTETPREKLDSKGFRILKYQVPELKYFTRDEMLELLVKNVLYSDDDVIVLNKPYNLVMHESKTSKDACLSNYLDDLAGELDKKSAKPKLLTVHRLDKETTGCLLLARNDASAQYLKSLFAQRKIVKTYWIVTIKVPDPLQGIIDMPIAEGLVDNKSRMVLNPDLPKDIPYRNHSKRGKNAVTHYNVIAESGNAALVEVKPETGIKHQIRVHFGFGLACPILGDHKYSYPDKLVPQKLQTDVLHKLMVRQSKVRYIPMHIYARSIFIPQYSEGRNLFVMAPMPIHMSKNLQRLKFKKK